MMERTVRPAARGLRGTLRVPPDKSVSHRAVMLGAMAEGESVLHDVLASDDVASTISCVESLGAEVTEAPAAGDAHPLGRDLRVRGWGGDGPTAPSDEALLLECGNSGTTARLLAGVVAGWPVRCRFTGDDSLSRRPMERIARPLRRMGAEVSLSEGGTLPMEVVGGDLSPVEWDSTVASAQVKTCVAFAALRASGTTCVSEPAASRDHTERMLPCFGVDVERSAGGFCVTGPVVPRACELRVPGDPSSAAFIIAGALMVPGSEVVLEDVMLNPTRTGYLAVLERMGAAIEVLDFCESAGEPVGSIHVRYTEGLRSTVVGEDEIPSLIDEVPVLALIAARAEGETVFDGVGELRVKESDRLAAIAGALRAFGVSVDEDQDTLRVTGPSSLSGARVSSLGDHRLAMTYHVAGLAAESPVLIEGYEAVTVSYPAFAEDIAMLTGDVGPDKEDPKA